MFAHSDRDLGAVVKMNSTRRALHQGKDQVDYAAIDDHGLPVGAEADGEVE